jgi:hypothetical protein
MKGEFPKWREGEGRGGCILLIKQDKLSRLLSNKIFSAQKIQN